jgi:hypothetical protein
MEVVRISVCWGCKSQIEPCFMAAPASFKRQNGPKPAGGLFLPTHPASNQVPFDNTPGANQSCAAKASDSSDCPKV